MASRSPSADRRLVLPSARMDSTHFGAGSLPRTRSSTMKADPVVTYHMAHSKFYSDHVLHTLLQSNKRPVTPKSGHSKNMSLEQSNIKIDIISDSHTPNRISFSPNVKNYHFERGVSPSQSRSASPSPSKSNKKRLKKRKTKSKSKSKQSPKPKNQLYSHSPKISAISSADTHEFLTYAHELSSVSSPNDHFQNPDFKFLPPPRPSSPPLSSPPATSFSPRDGSPNGIFRPIHVTSIPITDKKKLVNPTTASPQSKVQGFAKKRPPYPDHMIALGLNGAGHSHLICNNSDCSDHGDNKSVTTSITQSHNKVQQQKYGNNHRGRMSSNSPSVVSPDSHKAVVKIEGCSLMASPAAAERLHSPKRSFVSYVREKGWTDYKLVGQFNEAAVLNDDIIQKNDKYRAHDAVNAYIGVHGAKNDSWLPPPTITTKENNSDCDYAYEESYHYNDKKNIYESNIHHNGGKRRNSILDAKSESSVLDHLPKTTINNYLISGRSQEQQHLNEENEDHTVSQNVRKRNNNWEERALEAVDKNSEDVSLLNNKPRRSSEYDQYDIFTHQHQVQKNRSNSNNEMPHAKPSVSSTSNGTKPRLSITSTRSVKNKNSNFEEQQSNIKNEPDVILHENRIVSRSSSHAAITTARYITGNSAAARSSLSIRSDRSNGSQQVKRKGSITSSRNITSGNIERESNHQSVNAHDYQKMPINSKYNNNIDDDIVDNRSTKPQFTIGELPPRQHNAASTQGYTQQHNITLRNSAMGDRIGASSRSSSSHASMSRLPIPASTITYSQPPEIIPNSSSSLTVDLTKKTAASVTSHSISANLPDSRDVTQLSNGRKSPAFAATQLPPPPSHGKSANSALNVSSQSLMWSGITPLPPPPSKVNLSLPPHVTFPLSAPDSHHAQSNASWPARALDRPVDPIQCDEEAPKPLGRFSTVFSDTAASDTIEAVRGAKREETDKARDGENFPFEHDGGRDFFNDDDLKKKGLKTIDEKSYCDTHNDRFPSKKNVNHYIFEKEYVVNHQQSNAPSSKTSVSSSSINKNSISSCSSKWEAAEGVEIRQIKKEKVQSIDGMSREIVEVEVSGSVLPRYTPGVHRHQNAGSSITSHLERQQGRSKTFQKDNNNIQETHGVNSKQNSIRSMANTSGYVILEQPLKPRVVNEQKSNYQQHLSSSKRGKYPHLPHQIKQEELLIKSFSNGNNLLFKKAVNQEEYSHLQSPRSEIASCNGTMQKIPFDNRNISRTIASDSTVVHVTDDGADNNSNLLKKGAANALNSSSFSSVTGLNANGRKNLGIKAEDIKYTHHPDDHHAESTKLHINPPSSALLASQTSGRAIHPFAADVQRHEVEGRKRAEEAFTNVSLIPVNGDQSHYLHDDTTVKVDSSASLASKPKINSTSSRRSRSRRGSSSRRLSTSKLPGKSDQIILNITPAGGVEAIVLPSPADKNKIETEESISVNLHDNTDNNSSSNIITVVDSELHIKSKDRKEQTTEIQSNSIRRNDISSAYQRSSSAASIKLTKKTSDATHGTKSGAAATVSLVPRSHSTSIEYGNKTPRMISTPSRNQTKHVNDRLSPHRSVFGSLSGNQMVFVPSSSILKENTPIRRSGPIIVKK